LTALGRFDEAAAAYARALKIDEGVEGGASDGAAELEDDMADLALRRGRASEALGLNDRALATYGRLHGAADPRVGRALDRLAEALLALRRSAEARPLLERAVAILDAPDGAPIDLAAARFGLARALGRDAAGAVQLATAARTTLAAAGRPGAEELER